MSEHEYIKKLHTVLNENKPVTIITTLHVEMFEVISDSFMMGYLRDMFEQIKSNELRTLEDLYYFAKSYFEFDMSFNDAHRDIKWKFIDEYSLDLYYNLVAVIRHLNINVDDYLLCGWKPCLNNVELIFDNLLNEEDIKLK